MKKHEKKYIFFASNSRRLQTQRPTRKLRGTGVVIFSNITKKGEKKNRVRLAKIRKMKEREDLENSAEYLPN